MPEPYYLPWDGNDPVVTVTLHDTGEAVIRLYGLLFDMPHDFAPATRDTLWNVLEHIYRRLGDAYTLEIVEADGSRQTGMIDLHHPNAIEPTDIGHRPAVDADSSVDRLVDTLLSTLVAGDTAPSQHQDWPPEDVDATDSLVEEATWIRIVDDEPEPAHPSPGGSFAPGERVAVCLWLGEIQADADGHVPVEAPAWLGGFMVLAGRDSNRVEYVQGGRL